MARLRIAALLAVALAVAGCAHRGKPPRAAPAPAAGVRLAIDVGDHGEVAFLVPNGWKATSGEPDPPLPGSIRFEPPAGHFLVTVTPLWGPGEATEPLDSEVARLLVEAARDRALAGALEAELPVRELDGPGLPGWYYAVTDRDLVESKRPPGPDEYRCLMQGAVVAGQVVLVFSLLDDGDGPHRAQVLGLVRGATHRPAAVVTSPGPSSEPPGRSHADPATWPVHGPEPLELSLPGRSWSLLLDVAGWRVADTMSRLDGSGVTVIGQRGDDGLVLSASLVDAAGRKGAEACRAGDWERIKQVEGVGETRLDGAGEEEARAWYTVQGEGEPTRHLSAWRYRDGACIHLHLSLPRAAAGAEATLERALGVARYGESL